MVRGASSVPHAGPGIPGRGRPLLPVLSAVGVGVVVLAVHWPVLSAGALSFDDREAITENYLIQDASWASVRQIFGEVVQPSTIRGYYRPLTQISFMLDWAMGGRPTNLRPFHRTSLALHTANAVLVMVILYQFFGNPWAAAAVALVFGLHPLTVEPVAWVMERKTPLATFFALCSLAMYVRYAHRRGRAWYGGSLLAFVLALMSKPTSTPLPLVMLLVDYWPLRRLNVRAVVEKLPFLAAAAAGAAIAYLCEDHAQRLDTFGGGTAARMPLRIGYLVVFYLAKMVWPVNLGSAYGLPEPLSLSNPWILLGVLGTCGLAAALVLSLRRTPALMVGGLCFLLAIAPTFGVVQYTWVVASDKYVYLPVIGLLLVLAWSLCRLFEKIGRSRRRWSAAAAVVVVIGGVVAAEAVATRRQIGRWQDTEGYLRYMIGLGQKAPALHLDYGVALTARGDMDEALKHFREAVRLKPDYIEARTNVATALARQGRMDEAVEAFREALRLRPDYYLAHHNLGQALAQQGNHEEAMDHFLQALSIKPNYPDARNSYGLELLRRGRIAEAAAEFEEAIRLNADGAEAYYNLGLALVRLGRNDTAVGRFRKAVALDPANAEWRLHLGDALARQGQADAALREYREALRLAPDSPAAMNNVAWFLATRSESTPSDAEEAVRLAERACERTGHGQPGALDTLAAAYAAAGRFEDAARTARRAVEQADADPRQKELAAALRRRLSLYEAGRPYRETPQAATGQSPPP